MKPWKFCFGVGRWALAAFALGAFVSLLVGCVGVSATDKAGNHVSVHAPAWPWSDVAQTFERLQVKAKTNAFEFTMRDGATDSHVSPVVGEIVGKAVGAGITAALESFAPGLPRRRAPVEDDEEPPKLKASPSVARTNAPAGTNGVAR